MTLLKKIALAMALAADKGLMRIANAAARFVLSVAPLDKQIEVEEMALRFKKPTDGSGQA